MAILVRENESLGTHTTFGIPSIAEFFTVAASAEELAEALAFARGRGFPTTIIAGGSNIVCTERVEGLVIKIALRGRAIEGELFTVAAGESLLETVRAANATGLGGLETLAGIPGTVGGAIVGNAGAYGTEIGSRVQEVEVCDGSEVRVFSRAECAFAYRDSIFKKNRELIVLSVALKLFRGDAAALSQKSASIIAERERKYPPGLRCPGSFFKNIPEGEVASELLADLPERALAHGKIAVGYLIEAVEGRGLCVGGACVADYHGNLVINGGGASFGEVRTLAEELKRRVKERFGIELEEEIRYIV